MKFEAKHVVAIVVAVSAAAVLTPVSVVAATGTLVHITDPVYSARKVRVGSNGALQVETRAGATPTAVNVFVENVTHLNPNKLLEVVGPNRMALTDFTFTVRKFGSPVVAPTIVNLMSYVQASGTATCGLSGWAPTVLRRFSIDTGETMHVNFDGPPLMVPPAPSGKKQCLAAELYQWVGDTRVDLGATVFSYA